MLSFDITGWYTLDFHTAILITRRHYAIIYRLRAMIVLRHCCCRFTLIDAAPPARSSAFTPYAMPVATPFQRYAALFVDAAFRRFDFARFSATCYATFDCYDAYAAAAMMLKNIFAAAMPDAAEQLPRCRHDVFRLPRCRLRFDFRRCWHGARARAARECRRRHCRRRLIIARQSPQFARCR